MWLIERQRGRYIKKNWILNPKVVLQNVCLMFSEHSLVLLFRTDTNKRRVPRRLGITQWRSCSVDVCPVVRWAYGRNMGRSFGFFFFKTVLSVFFVETRDGTRVELNDGCKTTADVLIYDRLSLYSDNNVADTKLTTRSSIIISIGYLCNLHAHPTYFGNFKTRYPGYDPVVKRVWTTPSCNVI